MGPHVCVTWARAESKSRRERDMLVCVCVRVRRHGGANGGERGLATALVA